MYEAGEELDLIEIKECIRQKEIQDKEAILEWTGNNNKGSAQMRGRVTKKEQILERGRGYLHRCDLSIC